MLDDDDERLIREAAEIGRAMLETIRAMAAREGLSSAHYIPAMIQAMIAVNAELIEDG